MEDEGVMIIIDNAVGSKQLVNYPPLNDPDIAVLDTLESGDAMFIGNGPDDTITVGIEVKRIDDFVGSSRSGRLWDVQIPNMLKSFDVSWLVWYGVYQATKNWAFIDWYRESKGWQRLEIPGKKGRKGWCVPFLFLQSLIAKVTSTGVHCLHCPTVWDVAMWLSALYRHYQKPYEDQTGLGDKFFSPEVWAPRDSEDTEVVRLARGLSGIPGISRGRAMKAIETFGSVEDAITADVADWMRIPGIGQAVANQVVRFVRTRVKE